MTQVGTAVRSEIAGGKLSILATNATTAGSWPWMMRDLADRGDVIRSFETNPSAALVADGAVAAGRRPAEEYGLVVTAGRPDA
jgi:hypothetical protein